MLPGHLIVGYWAEVQEFLKKRHGLDGKLAQDGIVDDRSRLDSHGVGDMVYHQDASHVATMIVGAIRQGGFREPATNRQTA